MVSFRKTAYQRKPLVNLLVSPPPNWGRGRAPYPRKSKDFLGTPVSALRGGEGLEEPAIQLSFRAAGEIHPCHFEPKARNLEFQSLPVLRIGVRGCRISRF